MIYVAINGQVNGRFKIRSSGQDFLMAGKTIHTTHQAQESPWVRIPVNAGEPAQKNPHEEKEQIHLQGGTGSLYLLFPEHASTRPWLRTLANPKAALSNVLVYTAVKESDEAAANGAMKAANRALVEICLSCRLTS